MPKSLVEMAADIISAQASHSRMTAEEMTDSIEKVFGKLKEIKSAETTGTEIAETKEGLANKPQISPKDSIKRGSVICLECGKEFKILSKTHLSTHGITSKEYRKKYGLSARTPLVAKSLVAQKRKFAIEKGLGKKLAEYRKKKAKAKTMEPTA